MFCVKEHSSGAGSVLAVCDREVLCETLSDGDLEFTVSERFYGGGLHSPEEAVARIKGAENANLVGERIIALAIEHDLIDENSVRKIGGVSHAIRMVV